MPPRPGRKPQGERARINIQVAPETRHRLERIGGGPRRIGLGIEKVLAERDKLLLHVQTLEDQIEGLKGRLHELSPTDLP